MLRDAVDTCGLHLTTSRFPERIAVEIFNHFAKSGKIPAYRL